MSSIEATLADRELGPRLLQFMSACDAVRADDKVDRRRAQCPRFRPLPSAASSAMRLLQGGRRTVPGRGSTWSGYWEELMSPGGGGDVHDVDGDRDASRDAPDDPGDRPPEAGA